MSFSESTLIAMDELNRIDEAIGRAAEAAGVALERVSTGGMILTLYFADRSMMVVNVQPFDGQISLGLAVGFFRLEAGRWVSTADGSEMYAVLSEHLSRRTGATLTVAPSSGR